MRAAPRILLLFGTRPEAIKMASVVAALRRHPALTVRVAVTGQHRSLLDQALAALELVPDVDLDLMRAGQPHRALLGGLILGIAENYGQSLFGGDWRDVVAFVLLVGVLMFRPTGILGESLGKARV